MPNSNTTMPAPPRSGAKPLNKRSTTKTPHVEYRVRPKVVKAVEKGKCKLTQLMEYLDSIKDQKFTGYIKVNFTQGTIGRVERFEEILRK